MLDTVIPIVHQAGSLLLDCFSRRVPAIGKGYLDIVSEADIEASRLLTRLLSDAFPGQHILSEEHDLNTLSSDCWILDPLDGTKNFCHGHPFFCVSVARISGGRPVLAVTHDPVRNETFSAVLNQGARLNGVPIAVSAVSQLDQALITSGFPSGKRHRNVNPRPFLDISANCQALRRTGSSALDLAYVASGRFDAAWDLSLEVWDVAGGILLVQEAGGRCTDWRGAAYQLNDPQFLATNGYLGQQLIRYLSEAG